MLRIPREHEETIKALVAADPEVAQATCDIPHLDPSRYIRPGETGEALPYCGCFVGVYAWMQECKRGNAVPLHFEIPEIVAECVGCHEWAISEFAGWCNTPTKDRLAVRYARGLLATANQE